MKFMRGNLLAILVMILLNSCASRVKMSMAYYPVANKMQTMAMLQVDMIKDTRLYKNQSKIRMSDSMICKFNKTNVVNAPEPEITGSKERRAFLNHSNRQRHIYMPVTHLKNETIFKTDSTKTAGDNKIEPIEKPIE